MKKANKKIDVLLEAVGDLNFDFLCIGDALCIPLDGERHVTIEFAKSRIADRWEGIQLMLVSKNRGTLETCRIPFAEAFLNPIDETHPNRLEKYVWKYGGACDWYGKPTEADLERLRNQICAYLRLVA